LNYTQLDIYSQSLTHTTIQAQRVHAASGELSHWLTSSNVKIKLICGSHSDKIGMWQSWSKFAFAECEFQLPNSFEWKLELCKVKPIWIYWSIR